MHSDKTIAWEIIQCDEESEELNLSLAEGYEPFSVTRELRVTETWSDSHYHSFRGEEFTNVIWLRKIKKGEQNE